MPEEKTFLGYYVNADEIQKEFTLRPLINLASYGIWPKDQEWNSYLEESTMVRKIKEVGDVIHLTFRNNVITTGGLVNAYEAALLAEFIRIQLLKHRATFSIETVMSHPSKLEFVMEAKGGLLL